MNLSALSDLFRQIFPSRQWTAADEALANADGWGMTKGEHGWPSVRAVDNRFAGNKEASLWVLAHIGQYPCHKFFYLLGKA